MWTAFNGKLAGKWAKIVALALAASAAGVSATPAMADPPHEKLRERIHDRLDAREGRREKTLDRISDRHPLSPVALEVDARTGRRGDDRHDWRDRREARRDEPRYEERRVRVWVPPVYKTVCDRVWVEPEYRTTYDRVWHEPVVKTERERVWVPARYEDRWVTRVDFRGARVRVCERVCVEPGHYEERRREVVVRPGYWETVERRELASAGHWKTVERQELVHDGHYEWRTDRVKVADRGPRGFGFEIGLNID